MKGRIEVPSLKNKYGIGMIHAKPCIKFNAEIELAHTPGKTESSSSCIYSMETHNIIMIS